MSQDIIFLIKIKFSRAKKKFFESRKNFLDLKNTFWNQVKILLKQGKIVCAKKSYFSAYMKNILQKKLQMKKMNRNNVLEDCLFNNQSSKRK